MFGEQKCKIPSVDNEMEMERAEGGHLPMGRSSMEFLILVLEMFSMLYFSKKTEMVEFRSQIKTSAFRCPHVDAYKQSR